MTHAPGITGRGFLFVMAFTTVLYVNFAWFREQLCIIICPYGRFQSVLIDNHSKNVAYDANRGDPPGKAEGSGGRGLHRLQALCPGLPDRHRYPPRPPARMRRLFRLYRCL
jgi:polyferredoxin